MAVLIHDLPLCSPHMPSYFCIFSHIIFIFYLIPRIKSNNFTYYVIVIVVGDVFVVDVVELNVWIMAVFIHNLPPCSPYTPSYFWIFSHIIFIFYLIPGIKSNTFTYYVIVIVVGDVYVVDVVELNVWKTTPSLHINRLVFLRETTCAFCMMETETLNNSWTKFVLLYVRKWLELVYFTDLRQHELLTEH